MNIVHVVPITRGIGKETLSYFTASEVKPGSIVKVPIRTKSVPALVVSVEAASDLKAELKSSPFSIRKIGKLHMLPIFLPAFIDAAKDAAEYFASSTGSVLASITSRGILEQSEKITEKEITSVEHAVAEVTHEPYALQADEEERIAHYKSLIREQFAKKRSIFFCLPTIQDTKKIFDQLPKGIEEYTHVLNSSLSKKDLITTWNKILDETHPVLIIATGSFIGIPRRDIGMIIIERESSTSYKLQTRPYLDIRTFAEFFARRIQAKLIFGDLLLRTETLWRTKNGEMAELSPLKFRSMSTAKDVIIDMKKYKLLDTPEFRIVSDDLEELIRRNKEQNENMFIFAARRGLAPLTVCGDCATTVLCHRCNAPITLHRGREGNFFLCHRCGERRSAEERCRVCGSWKLTTLGIGIELIEDVLKNMFPEVKIFRMDKDSVTTHKQALALVSQFYNAPGSILLGTEMALLYLEKTIDNAGVASIDSLFSIPDFRVNERIMNILLKIRSITQKTFVVQTRSRDQHIFDYATKGNLMDFYREEIDERKKLNYPPFSTLIKITIKGPKDRTVQDMNMIQKNLHEYEPVVFPAFIDTVNNKSIMHALIKINHTDWISKPLLEKLLALPPYVSVNVDPESLL
ncbi:MAG: primosomal protein [Candidatus Paceibacter sp.]|jgi:primosomal protein N' (replication factor Y)|nr:primosomal protein [Candidatus Paceibacter sp.]